MYSQLAAILKLIKTKEVPEALKVGIENSGRDEFPLGISVTPGVVPAASKLIKSTPLNRLTAAFKLETFSGKEPLRLIRTVSVSVSPQIFRKLGTEAGFSYSTRRLS